MSYNGFRLSSQHHSGFASSMTTVDVARSKHSLHLHPGVRQAFRDLARQMLGGLGADQCALFGWDDDQQRLVFLQACDKNNAPMSPWNGHASVLITSPAMQSVLSSGLSLSVSLENGCTPAEEKVLAHFQCHSLVLVPVGTDRNRIGVVTLLLSSGQRVLEERDARFLNLLAAQGMKQIEQKFLQADNQRGPAAKMKDAWQEDGFLLAISRDLQAPLGAIAGLAELMRAGSYGELPAELAHPLDRVLCNISILIDTVSELAEWGRGGIGHFMLYPEWLELPEMLLAAIEALEPIISNAASEGHDPRHINLVCADDLPLVFVDISRIRQVISNLVMTLHNILPEGQLSVTSQVVDVKDGWCDAMSPPDTQRLPDGQWIEVSVGIAGEGVSQQVIQSLAETCAQPRGQENTWPDGALGLIIAKRLMALHGSIVWVTPYADAALQAAEDTAARPGLTFSFALPVRPQQAWMGRRWQGVEPTVQRRTANRPLPYRPHRSGELFREELIRY